jgi:hypothetical protein
MHAMCSNQPQHNNFQQSFASNCLSECSFDILVESQRFESSDSLTSMTNTQGISSYDQWQKWAERSCCPNKECQDISSSNSLNRRKRFLFGRKNSSTRNKESKSRPSLLDDNVDEKVERFMHIEESSSSKFLTSSR